MIGTAGRLPHIAPGEPASFQDRDHSGGKPFALRGLYRRFSGEHGAAGRLLARAAAAAPARRTVSFLIATEVDTAAGLVGTGQSRTNRSLIIRPAGQLLATIPIPSAKRAFFRGSLGPTLGLVHGLLFLDPGQNHV